MDVRRFCRLLFPDWLRPGIARRHDHFHKRVHLLRRDLRTSFWSGIGLAAVSHTRRNGLRSHDSFVGTGCAAAYCILCYPVLAVAAVQFVPSQPFFEISKMIPSGSLNLRSKFSFSWSFPRSKKKLPPAASIRFCVSAISST